MQKNARDFSILKTRILQYLEYKGITKYQCYKDCGLSNGILTQPNGLSEDNTIKFLSYYSDVNPEWFFTGQGEMLKGEVAAPEPQIVHFEMPGEDYTAIPVVDIEAAAGFGAANTDYIDESQLIYLPKSMLRGQRDRLCIKVSGDSMEPTLYNNSRVVIRLLDEGEWEYAQTGEIYVVTDREGQTYIKRLTNNLRTTGNIILHSDNENQLLYKPFSMPEEDILRIWAVELYLVRKVSDPTQQRINERELRVVKKQISDLSEVVEKLATKIEKGQ